MTKKQWQLQQIIGQLHTLSVTLAADVARHSAEGRLSPVKEEHIVADETRNIFMKATAVLEKQLYYDMEAEAVNEALTDIKLQTMLLSVNAGLAASKTELLRPLAVFADEIREVSAALETICETNHLPVESRSPIWDIPVPEPQSTVYTDRIRLFTAMSGRYVWTENTCFVQEVLRYCPEFIHDGQLQIIRQWPSKTAPIPVLWPDPDEKDAPCLVIVCAHDDPCKKYAVAAELPVDTAALFGSHLGVAAPHTLPIPVREYWRGLDGNDFCFLDWEKIALL